MKFSDKLLQLRKKAGLSQEELAEKIGVSRQAISRWEMGTAMPDAPNLMHISDLFGISIDYLLHDDYESDNDIPSVKEVNTKMKAKESQHKKAYLITAILMYFAMLTFFLAFAVGANFLTFVAGILYFISGSGFLHSYFKEKSNTAKKEDK